MKKYRVKIDMPNFEKGEILEFENGVYKNKYSWVERPIDYPDCFEEIKDPLFVTDDGVGIFDETETIYGVCTFLNKDSNSIVKHQIRQDLNQITYKWFSTKAAAEKWIDENKPEFSKKQVNKAIDKAFHKTIHPGFISSFKEKLGL